MKIVYENKTDKEKKLEEKKRIDEAKVIAQETLALVENGPDELFPEFLWKPLINEFEVDDGYLLRGSCEDEVVNKAYEIQRKNNTYWDYVDAMQSYLDYAQYIEDTYGSFDMIKRAVKEGISSIFIPPMPKLANKKTNKKILKSGFIPSRNVEDWEEETEIIEELIELTPERELSDKVKIPKYMKEIQKRAIEKKEKSDRIGGIMKYSGNAEFNQGTDAIISYLTTQQTGDITSDDDYMSISESIEEDHMYDYLPEEVVDDMITPAEVRKVVDSGRMINYAEYKKIEIIKTLEENGFNFFSNLLTEGMDKDAIRAISRQFNMDRISEEDLKNMTKKQRKKLKKLMQKQKKDRVDRMVADRRISEMMLKSRVRLAVEDNDITNFRLSDVIPDDYD